MKRLLIFSDFFLPGFKAGGIVQFIANLSACIKSDFDLHIITSNIDFGESKPYPNIKSNQWQTDFDKIKIFYLSKDHITYKQIKLLIKQVNPEIIYLNSMFSLGFTILPLIASLSSGRKDKKCKIVLAPNGMLQKGALKYKWFKKQIYLKIFRWSSLSRKILFHASEPVEYENIKLVFGNNVAVKLVHYFPSINRTDLANISKSQGHLRCLYVSRILPLKNLLQLLNVLEKVNQNVLLTIVGPIENQEYWQLCKALISKMPANICIDFKGAVIHSELNEIYKQHHLFILLTESENFGQVIFDALLCGRPVLISDQTPWKNLEQKGIGWDLPLAAPDLFNKAINEAISWDQYEFDSHCRVAWEYAQNYISELNLREDYIDLFS